LQVLAPVNATFVGLSLEGLHETETSRIAGPQGLKSRFEPGSAPCRHLWRSRTDRRSVARGGFADSGKVQPAERSSEAFRKLE